MTEKYIHLRIMELLAEQNISKNKICRDVGIDRTNFNRYCKDQFQRIDASLILKLCDYFHCNIADLIEIREK